MRGIDALLRSGSPPLIDVLERIGAAPTRRVVVERPQVPVSQVRLVEAAAVADALEDFGAIEVAEGPPVHATIGGRPVRFLSLRDTRRRITSDVAPTRYVARFVARARAAGPSEDLAARLDRLAAALPRPGRERLPGDPVLRHDPLHRRVVVATAELDRGLRD